MKKEIIAYSKLIFATFLFSLFGVFTRLIADNLGVFFQLLLRVALMSVIFFAIGYLTKIYKKISRSDLPLFIFRGFLIIVDFSGFYIAVNNLQLGLALFIFYAANIIISFGFGTIFLKEKLNVIKIIGLIVAIIGLYIMHNDSFNSVKLWPSIAALISGFCFGLTTSTSKKLTDKYDSTQVNLVAYAVAFLLVIPLLIISKEIIPSTITTLTILELIGFSIVGVGAFYLTLDGYKYIEAQKASLIMLLELVFVIIVGYLFFSEIPTINTIIGGVLILVALALPNINLVKIFSKKTSF
jgi:drug/metabolite transporter (DMT)-like permease